MTTEPETAVRRTEPGLSIIGSGANGTRSQEQPADAGTEIRLRARIEQLETALLDAARCLEDAERRAAEVLAMERELGPARVAVRKLEVIEASRSWRLTTPLRRYAARARRLLKR
jgi:hypothetical protein